MDKKIILAIRKVLNESKYEDLKSEIDSLRSRWGTQVSVVAVIHAAVTSLKDIITLDFEQLLGKKEEYIFQKKTMNLTNELFYLEDIMRKIKLRDKTDNLKKEDLEYYGFDYDNLINDLDQFLKKYEPYVMSRGGYVRDKNDEEFNRFIKQLKPLRKLKDKLEGLE